MEKISIERIIKIIDEWFEKLPHDEYLLSNKIIGKIHINDLKEKIKNEQKLK